MTIARHWRSALAAGAAALAVLLAGCGHQHGPAAQSAAGSGSVLRIGYQKGDSMNVLRVRGDLDRRLAARGVSVQWLNFPAGPQMLEAIGVGSLDLGATGDAAAIFAQASGVPLVYVANEPPGAGDSRAILVPKNSPIRTVADLRGKRIAIQKGSGTHNFLIQALDKAGVPYTQIQPAYLAPPDASAAFSAGQVDAWAIWDPFLSIAERQTGARVLVNGAGIVSAGGFYLSSRDFAVGHPDLIKIALEEVDKTSRWAAAHPHEAAEMMAPKIGMDVASLEQMERRRPQGDRSVGFRPIDSSVMAAQQTIADNFARIGLLPHAVNVRQGLLTPQQYAALTPAPAPRTRTTLNTGDSHARVLVSADPGR